MLNDGPFSISGFQVGHWTDPEGVTGCTVLVADRLVPAAVDVRGGAPGTRETSLLASGRRVQRADAILLTGGSAFGLAAADGVMSRLRELGRGFPTEAIPVPIVSAAVIFDLQRELLRWPGHDSGYIATMSARADGWRTGRFGAGAGATVAKGAGRHRARPGGIGVASVTTPDATVAALFVVNAYGDVFDDQSGAPLATPTATDAEPDVTTEQRLLDSAVDVPFGENTTIGVLVCDRPISHDALERMCIAGHSGLSRVIRPSHTLVDGDTVFALAPETEPVPTALVLQLSAAAQVVTARAVTNAVRGDA